MNRKELKKTRRRIMLQALDDTAIVIGIIVVGTILLSMIFEQFNRL